MSRSHCLVLSTQSWSLHSFTSASSISPSPSVLRKHWQEVTKMQQNATPVRPWMPLVYLLIHVPPGYFHLPLSFSRIYALLFFPRCFQGWRSLFPEKRINSLTLLDLVNKLSRLYISGNAGLLDWHEMLKGPSSIYCLFLFRGSKQLRPSNGDCLYIFRVKADETTTVSSH